MTLSEKQMLFADLVGVLIMKVVDLGYDGVTFGEAYRTVEQAALYAASGKGIKNSVHCKRLAVDLNAFKDGHYLTDAASYKPLGEYWKSLDPSCRWGGDFTHLSDPFHFSFEHEGVM